jgi:hypothetical protein
MSSSCTIVTFLESPGSTRRRSVHQAQGEGKRDFPAAEVAHGQGFERHTERVKHRWPAGAENAGGFSHLIAAGLSTGANRSENVAALAFRAAASEDEIRV